VHDHVLVPLADRLPVSTSNFGFDFKVKRFLRGAKAPVELRHPTWLGSFTPEEQEALLLKDFADPFDDWRQASEHAPSSDPIERLIYLYAKTYLHDDILVKVDRASMACSLEVRAPFLDVELVEFLARVPSRLKLRRFQTKRLLKLAMRDILPRGIATRPKKGFGVPIAAWFKGPLREALLDELAPDRLRRQGIFDAPIVQRLITEHMAGRRDHRKSLWTLYVFQLWHRRWVEGSTRSSAAVARA
jgi:asparagine synthase (glutamine-hydrolysing)